MWPGVGVVRLANVVIAAAVLAIVGYFATVALVEHNETARSTPRYVPPVQAGQNVNGACSGGFYARHESTIVITLSAHCRNPGETLLDDQGRVAGLLGPRANLEECPVGRVCAPSDFLTLALVADRIPWGHLNEVDMGAGGYRTFGAGTRALACADIRVGDRVEIDGREHYRVGKVLDVAPYHFETDTIFPCMVLVDNTVAIGDSGAAVLVNGQPAGVVAREFDRSYGFTPLAEGLEELGLILCTTPDCELSTTTSASCRSAARMWETSSSATAARIAGPRAFRTDVLAPDGGHWRPSGCTTRSGDSPQSGVVHSVNPRFSRPSASGVKP